MEYFFTLFFIFMRIYSKLNVKTSVENEKFHYFSNNKKTNKINMIRCMKTTFIGKEGRQNGKKHQRTDNNDFDIFQMLSYNSFVLVTFGDRHSFQAGFQRHLKLYQLFYSLQRYHCLRLRNWNCCCYTWHLISLTLSFSFSYCRRFSLRCHVKTEEG